MDPTEARRLAREKLAGTRPPPPGRSLLERGIRAYRAADTATGGAVFGPVAGSIEALGTKYEQRITNPVQRLVLAGMEAVAGKPLSTASREWGVDIDLIEPTKRLLDQLSPIFSRTIPYSETLVPGGFTAGGFVGLANEVISDPATVLGFGLARLPTKALANTARHAQSALTAAKIPLAEQRVATVLSVLEAAADPAKAAALTDARLIDAATALRNTYRDNPARLAEAFAEAQAGLKRADEIAMEARNLGQTRRAQRAERAAQVPLEPPSLATRGERIRAGLAGAGFQLPTRAGQRLGSVVPFVETQARIAEGAAAAGRAVGGVIPEGVRGAARTARNLFQPLSRRNADYAELLEASQAKAGEAGGIITRHAQNVMDELRTLGVRTVEEGGELVAKAQRSDFAPNLVDLRKALAGYNDAALVLQRGAGVNVKEFARGRTAGRTAAALRRVGTGLPRVADEAIALIRKGDIAGAARAFEGRVPSIYPAERFVDALQPSGKALNVIRRVYEKATGRLQGIGRETGRLIKRREALGKRVAAHTLPAEPLVTISNKTLGDAWQSLGNVIERATRAGGRIDDATKKAMEDGLSRLELLRRQVVSTTLRSAVTNKLPYGQVLRIHRRERQLFAEANEKIGELLNRLGTAAEKERGAIASTAAGEMWRARDRAMRQAARGVVMTTKKRLAGMEAAARRVGVAQARRGQMETRIMQTERRLRTLTTQAERTALSARRRTEIAARTLGRARFNSIRMGRSYASAAGFTRGTREFQAAANSFAGYIEKVARRLNMEEVRPGQFISDIGREAAVSERAPMMLTEKQLEFMRLREPQRAQTGVKAGGEFAVEASLARTLRTVTAVDANKIFRGELSLDDFITDVYIRNPGEVGQALQDFLAIRESAIGQLGPNVRAPAFLLADGGMIQGVAADALRRNKDLGDFFIVDPWTTISRDASRAARRILRTDIQHSMANTFSKIPPIEGKVSRETLHNIYASLPGGYVENGAYILSPGVVDPLRAAEAVGTEIALAPGEKLIFLDRLVGDELVRVKDVFADAQTMGKLARGYDVMLNAWRRMVTIGVGLPSVAFNVRNLLSDMYMATVAGVQPFSRAWGNSSILTFVLRHKDKEMFRPFLEKVQVVSKETGAKYTGYDILNLAANHGLVGRGASVMSDIMSRNAELLRRPTTASMARTALTAAPEAAADISASMGRLAMFIDGLENGLNPMRASLRTKATLYDYSQLTKFEKDIVRRVVPFYTWVRNNVPKQFEILATDPKGVLIPIRTAAISRREQDTPLPAWVERNVPLIVGSTPEQIRIMNLRNIIPAADIDVFVRAAQGDQSAWAQLLSETILGGPVAEAAGVLSNIDVFRTLGSTERVPVEGIPWESETVDLFGKKVDIPRRFAPLIPRPFSEIARVISNPEVNPLNIIGIPVRDFSKERLRSQAVREEIGVKQSAASALHSAIHGNSISGVQRALAVMREADAQAIQASGDAKRIREGPKAFRGPSRALVDLLADDTISDEVRNAVLDEFSRDMTPRATARLKARISVARRNRRNRPT